MRVAIAIWLVLLLYFPAAVSSARQTGAAQSESRPEGVFFDPEIAEVVPGNTISYEVQGTSMFEAFDLEVIVPGGLSIVGTPSCRAPGLVVPEQPPFNPADPEGLIPPSNASARPSSSSCTVDIVRAENGTTQIVAYHGPVTEPHIAYNVLLTFDLQVPSDSEPGVIYTLKSPIAGLRDETSVATLEVLDAAGEHVTPSDLLVRDPALAAQTVTVGSTTIAVFGDWEYDAPSSIDDQATFIQIDMENGVLKLVSYGVFEDETVDDPNQAIKAFTEAYFQSAGAQHVQENGSGLLEDGTSWRLYTFDLQAVQVSFLITANQNDDGAFVVTSLTANISVFADTIVEVQNDFLLNETNRMFEGLDPSELTQDLPI